MTTPDETSINENPREEYEKARKVVADLTALLAAPGWNLLVQLTNTQIEIRRIQSTNPMRGLEDVFERQTVAGEVTGMQTLLATPAALIEDGQHTVERLRELIANESGDGGDNGK